VSSLTSHLYKRDKFERALFFLLHLKAPPITTKNTTERFTKVKKLFASEDSLAPKASATEKKIKLFQIIKAFSLCVERCVFLNISAIVSIKQDEIFGEI
jgi:hypothetical protein